MPFDLADSESALSEGDLDPCIVVLSEITLEGLSPCMELRKFNFVNSFIYSLLKCIIIVCAWCVEEDLCHGMNMEDPCHSMQVEEDL